MVQGNTEQQKENRNHDKNATIVLKLRMILYTSILHTYTHAYCIYVYVGKKNRLYTFPTVTETNST